MEDRVPDDLDFAGNAGKGVFGAQTAHQGPRGGTASRKATRGRPMDVSTETTDGACSPPGTRMKKA